MQPSPRWLLAANQQDIQILDAFILLDSFLFGTIIWLLQLSRGILHGSLSGMYIVAIKGKDEQAFLLVNSPFFLNCTFKITACPEQFELVVSSFSACEIAGTQLLATSLHKKIWPKLQTEHKKKMASIVPGYKETLCNINLVCDVNH